ncbi:MAG: hypothetical protein IKY44_01735 [Clostridia bacterium]|nr:hypothetical protein [Clostridia bacterium]
MKKFLSVLTILVLILTLFTTQVYAHEIHNGAPVRIQDRNSQGGPSLHVYYKLLRNTGAPTHYYDCAIDAIDAWSGFANVTDDGCNQLAPTNMNISIKYSQTLWDQLGIPSTVMGMTWSVDTNGNDLLIEDDFINSTGIIDYSIIYLNPTGNIFSYGTTDTTIITNRIQKTIVHEMGHAMGLGHSDREDYDPISSLTRSVMRQGAPDIVNSGIVPQTHERRDLNRFY